jgi:autotransporter-associated beta strand protein
VAIGGLAILAALAAGWAQAAPYTWNLGDTGGNWSTTTNWNPNGNPTSGDTATLGDVTTGTRTVVYETGANSGTLTGLTLTQTSAAVNELEVQRSLTIADAVTLEASGGGTSRMFLDPEDGAATFATTFTGGVTVNGGGELRLGAFRSTSSMLGNVAGNVTVAGGSLVVAPRTGGSVSSIQNDINGTFTMTSGTLLLDNTGSGAADRRLRIVGTTDISGGDVTATVSGSNLMLQAGTVAFNPTTFNSANISLQFTGTNQNITTDKQLGATTYRGSGTATLTSSYSGLDGDIGSVQLVDSNSGTPGSRLTFTLGSDLAVRGGYGLPAASGIQTPESGRIDLGIDVDVNGFDLTAVSQVWTPNLGGSGGNVTSAFWNLAGDGGSIAANGFNFTTSGVTVDVGAGLTLESKAGNNVANNLGAGTIAATSTFLYSGAAAAGTPSTLVAAGTIGNVAVSSGALQLGSLGGIAGAATVSGGSLDLGGTTRTFTNVTLTGGEITAGTLSTSTQTSLQAGTISAAITGTGGFAKQGAGTVTLSAANSFSGDGFVQGGTLIAASNAALGDTVGTTRIDGGTTGAVLGLSGGITTAEPILMIMQGGAGPFSGLRNLAGDNRLTGPISLQGGGATWEIASDAGTLTIDGDMTSTVTSTDTWRTMGLDGPAAGVINGDIADSGTSKVNVTVRGGTWTIASNASYTGQTRVDAGTLLVDGSVAGTSAMTVLAGGRLGGSGSINTALGGAGLVSPGNSPGILTATQVDPTGGLDQAFEFTATGSPTYGNAAASVNDVLRLTDATTPFATSLSAGNVIDVYFDVAALAAGDTFKGGFYTDLASDFSGSIASATYAYWVTGNGSGTDTTFNGQGYYSLATFDPSLSVTLSTVAEAADFGSGTISGQVTQFAVVPEPGSLAVAGLAAATAAGFAYRRRRSHA